MMQVTEREVLRASRGAFSGFGSETIAPPAYEAGGAFCIDTSLFDKRSPGSSTAVMMMVRRRPAEHRVEPEDKRDSQGLARHSVRTAVDRYRRVVRGSLQEAVILRERDRVPVPLIA
jgi:hypothetical protein